MDEYNIDDTMDDCMEDYNTTDVSESLEKPIDVMDSAEVPELDENSFDNIENSNLENYEQDNIEDFDNEVDSAMSEVEPDELTFEDEPIENNAEMDLNSYIENSTDVEELRRLRETLLQEGTEGQDSELNDEIGSEDNYEGPVYTREITPEILESRNEDTDETLDNYRENLRDYDVPEEAIEEYVADERDKINAEYESLDRGDEDPNYYEMPNDWEGVAERLKEGTSEDIDFHSEIENDNDVQEQIDVSEIDYDEIYEELDSYDFDGIDYLQDTERLDNSLSSFEPEHWEEMDLDQQKEAMEGLAEYVQEITGLENPPKIEYYYNTVEGDYGGYSVDTNTLSINEYMLHDSNEAADTVAHELWHAYQHERALNPQSAKDYQYQYNFDHYIEPKQDLFGNYVNMNEYQDQLVEAEARAFANQFKGRIGNYGR